jgi:hypothetical protein
MTRVRRVVELGVLDPLAVPCAAARSSWRGASRLWKTGGRVTAGFVEEQHRRPIGALVVREATAPSERSAYPPQSNFSRLPHAEPQVTVRRNLRRADRRVEGFSSILATACGVAHGGRGNGRAVEGDAP